MEMILTLKGKTLKGKNRVREHGESWRVLERVKDGQRVTLDGTVLGSTTAAEGLLNVEPVVQSSRFPESRWIALVGDKDFEVVHTKVIN